MYDIAGPNCPLYGIKNGVSRKNAPKFKMSHMFAVIALNIVNEGHGGNIAVKSAGIAAAEEIVGDFDVNILGNPSKNIYDPVFTKKNAKTSTKVELSDAVVIGAGKSATLYLAVKPFDASGKELTISINGDAKKGNGASKTITMPAGSKFEAGKVTTITVPVEKLSFHYEEVDPATSNVMDLEVQVFDKIDWGKLKTKKGKAVTISNSSPVDVLINGKETKAYVIGTESKVGTVSIHGTARELISYMPMEFYAAAWDNKNVVQDKSVMRVESVTIHTDLAVAFLLGYKLSLTYEILTGMMDGGKITFSRLVPIEQVTYDGNNKSHMVIMDEEPYHKPISYDKFESLLANFDNDPKDKFDPTFEGLKQALINPGNLRSSYDLTATDLTEAEITAYVVWKKVRTKIESNSLLNFASSLMGSVMTSPKGLFEFAAGCPIDAVLTTVAKGGEEGATDNRVIFWGLNSPEAN